MLFCLFFTSFFLLFDLLLDNAMVARKLPVAGTSIIPVMISYHRYHSTASLMLPFTFIHEASINQRTVFQTVLYGTVLLYYTLLRHKFRIKIKNKLKLR